jgi:putative DNA primase/helicase
LTQYIQTRTPAEFASCTDRIGWHGRAFVLPKETIGDDAERIVFQSENQWKTRFASRARPINGASVWAPCVLAIPAWSSRWPVPLPGRCCARRV